MFLGLHFSRWRPQDNVQFLFLGKQLDIVNDFNNLGVGLSPIGNFKNAIEGNAEKATRALYECLRLGRLYILSIKCQLDFFDEMVKPVLLYGCEIWGMGNNDILERVHLTFCKLLLNLKTSTPPLTWFMENLEYIS